MAILLFKDTKAIVQGITGREGLFHAQQCREYGTAVAGGVTPGKGGTTVDGFPVFDTVEQAVGATGATASLIFVPPLAAADAIAEALDAGIKLIVCITEGIPVRDMMAVKRVMAERYPEAVLIGPNCPGLITPGQAKLGIVPGRVFKPGPVGLVSRSGTLTYEAAFQLSNLGLGQSTAVGIGGDPIHGLSHKDVIARFAADPETEAILMIGEIGGSEEEEAAALVAAEVKKPVVAYIAGITAPPGRRMGHAGAIISGGKGTAQAKIEALRAAGITVVENPAFIGQAVAAALGR